MCKATRSRLRQQCSDVSSRRKRQADKDDEELEDINQQLLTQALTDGRDDVERVCDGFLMLIFVKALLCRFTGSCLQGEAPTSWGDRPHTQISVGGLVAPQYIHQSFGQSHNLLLSTTSTQLSRELGFFSAKYITN